MTKEKFLTFYRRVPFGVKTRLLSLLMVGALTVVASLWIIFMILTVKDIASLPRPRAVARESQTEEGAPEFTFPYEMTALSIAVTDRRRLRTSYAQFALVMDCPSAKAVETLTLNRAKVLNTINEVATQFSFEDFKGPSGIRNFKAALKAQLKILFKENAPREIAIRDWLFN